MCESKIPAYVNFVTFAVVETLFLLSFLLCFPKISRGVFNLDWSRKRQRDVGLTFPHDAPWKGFSFCVRSRKAVESLFPEEIRIRQRDIPSTSVLFFSFVLLPSFFLSSSLSSPTSPITLRHSPPIEAPTRAWGVAGEMDEQRLDTHRKLHHSQKRS